MVADPAAAGVAPLARKTWASSAFAFFVGPFERAVPPELALLDELGVLTAALAEFAALAEAVSFEGSDLNECLSYRDPNCSKRESLRQDK